MRALKRLLGLAGLGALGYAAYRRTTGRPAIPSGNGTAQWAPLSRSASADPSGAGPPGEAPARTTPAEASKAPSLASVPGNGATAAWIVPVDGQCPESHPVKANANSGIYHLPGGRSYVTTRAERCYCDTASAEADGFRAAKR